MSGGIERTAIIFDLDGTLIDTAGDLAASMNHALGKIGVVGVPPKSVRHLVGRGARAMLVQGYKQSAGAEASDELINEAFNYFLRHYEENIAVMSRPFDGVLKLIGELQSAGVAVAICTNKRESLARRLIGELGMGSMISAIVGADTVAVAKPDPAPVYHCLKLTGAERGVFVGDSDTDIRAAMAAHMPCFIATFGYGPLTLSAKAEALFDHYDEAIDLFRRYL